MKVVRTIFLQTAGNQLIHVKGHRVATQYILAALEGSLPAEHLLHYREANSKLPGHPELGLTPGVKFSSGRLGHMWYVCTLLNTVHRHLTYMA